MYNYRVVELNVASQLQATTPCISRTLGDIIHVTWSCPGAIPATYYQTASTNPKLIRNTALPPPSFTQPPHALAEGPEQVSDAYSNYVTCLWRQSWPEQIHESHHYVHQRHDVWSVGQRWDELGYPPSEPTICRNAGVWRQSDGVGRPEIQRRFSGEPHASWLTKRSDVVDHRYPQVAVRLAPTRGGSDTLHVIWTERMESHQQPYAICYASFLHVNADRDWFYNVVCGEESPSPFCVHRDGAISYDLYSIDYADSALVYRLSCLDPRFHYRVHATVYHESPAPISEEFTFPVDSATTILGSVVSAEPGEPVEVWFDVPPQLHRDGVVDLVVGRLSGDYAAVAGIELQELEPEIAVPPGSGGQSGAAVGLEPPAAVLGVVPNPFAAAATIRYQLFSTATPSLEILDVTGRRVRVVTPRDVGPRRAGVYSVAWNGMDDWNRALPSGVYFCRLLAGAVTTTRSVVLLR